MTRRQILIACGALALTLVGFAGIAIAEDDALTDATLEKASAAALAYVGGGTVIESEARDDSAGYSIEIRRADGSVVEVDLDQNFVVVGQGGDEDAANEEEGPGEAEEPEDAAEPTEDKEGRLKTIPQPVLESTEVAPESKRVDLAMPTFSNPTKVTNPLFPVSNQESVLLLGTVDGKSFRTEVTLLPYARLIKWQGQTIETLVSQYVAYLDGRIHEAAYDLYAQADDGSVWYFGEDVLNFEDGVIVNMEGSWHAGEDGEAAMIMPANPKVGDVYRTENAPGLAFEEVTVKAVDQTLDGPFGPIKGGLLVEEFHLLDSNREEKTFAPGYGEFFTGSDGDIEAFALAVPPDAVSEPVPEELATLKTGASTIFEAAQYRNWKKASATAREMRSAWESYQKGQVPKLIEPRTTQALRSLSDAVNAGNRARSRQAAIHVANWVLDLHLRYLPPTAIDLARFDLWASQVLVDVAAGDQAAVNGDLFTLNLIRDRFYRLLDAADGIRLNTGLNALQSAAGDEDFAAIAKSARELRLVVAGLQAGH